MKTNGQRKSVGTQEAGGHIAARVSALVDGRASSAEAEAARKHCIDCAACREAWRETEAAWGALDADRVPPTPPSLWPRIAARTAGLSPRARLVLRVSGAAAAALGIVAGIFLGSQAVRPESGWQDTWGEFGTMLVDQHDASLGDIYLSMSETGGEEQ